MEIFTARELREKFLEFFKSKNHAVIPSASLVPQSDPSVLFTTAGMHPLVPYLMGEKHPQGRRLVDVQKCIRTADIDEVGDNRHLTFFEMLGNWSLGDYFKEEAIQWSWEFLTDKKWLGLDPKRIYITVFAGADGIGRDEDTIKIWKEVFAKAGIEAEVAGENKFVKDNVRIIPLGMKDNFWIAGEFGPCGSDSEMFYNVKPDEKMEGKFSDLVDKFSLIEIWNDVFMEFNKTKDGKYEKLSKPNVDTGMGVERTLAVLNSKKTVFDTELFWPIIQKIEKISGKKYEGNEKSFRIIADHLKAATFIIADGVSPLNVGRGYVLRRLIRRAVRYGKQLGIEEDFTRQIAEVVIGIYKDFYKELEDNKIKIFEELEKEENKFRKTLEKGEKEVLKLEGADVTGSIAFDIYQTYGFPLEMIEEILEEKGTKLKNKDEFAVKMQEHQDKSRTATSGMFKGGLADTNEQTKKLHTAAHLLLAALRKVLGEHVMQKGSNITTERLRFDFSNPEKLTPEQIKEVENLVNEQINKKLPVTMEEMSLEDAKKSGAMGVFESKYGEKVKVYTITDDTNIFSREICGGPHVQNTGELGNFRITKEQSSSGGVRRIKAVLE